MADKYFNYSYKHFNLSNAYTELPTDITTHVHDSYELYYYISGDLTYYIEGKAYNLKKNDIIITNRRELHRIVFNSDKCYKRKYIHFKPEYISSFQSEEYNMLSFIEKRKLGYFNKINAEDVLSSRIDKLWNNIEKYARENSPGHHIMVKTYFIQMLIAINNIYLKHDSALASSFENDHTITSILDYIKENLNTKITLDLLEDYFHVNKYYLCHIFKLATGFSVIEYITYKRILKSQELLLSGLSILDAANEVGFGDYSNFYKAFKKITGTSPKKYLNQLS